jgi:hypothetical protein
MRIFYFGPFGLVFVAIWALWQAVKVAIIVTVGFVVALIALVALVARGIGRLFGHSAPRHSRTAFGKGGWAWESIVKAWI